MIAPFSAERPAKELSFAQKLLRRAQPDAARTMMVNLLAVRPPADISATEIKEIAKVSRLSEPDVRGITIGLYRRAVSTFVADGDILDDERQYLDDLGRLFSLGSQDCASVEQEISEPFLSAAIDLALADDKMDDRDWAATEELGRKLRVPNHAISALVQEKAARILRAKVESAYADRRVSPREDQELEQLSRDLRTRLDLSDLERQQRDLFALYWHIENVAIPTVDVALHLQKGEVCHYGSPADWYELRTKTVRVDYSGVGARIRIVKGIYYRAGSYNVAPVRQDELTLIDSGTLYLTNKRIIFDGPKGNKTLRLSSLLGIHPYSDGIGLEKATGKSPIVLLKGNVELATIILSTLLAKSD